MLQVFSKGWFRRHQSKIILFSNTWWGKRILQLSDDGIGKSKIVEISPSHYVIASGVDSNGNEKFVSTFVPYEEYAKRLYTFFKPFWYALHFIDWLFHKLPHRRLRLNFGFDTLNFYPDLSGGAPLDGYVLLSQAGLTWEALRTATDGSSYQTASILSAHVSGENSNECGPLHRSHVCFDTEVFTDYDRIASATLSLKNAYASSNDLGLSEYDGGLEIVESVIDDDNALQFADYSKFESVSFCHKDYSEVVQAGGWTEFILNAAGIESINRVGFTKFCMILSCDLNGVEPVWSPGLTHSFAFDSSEDGINNAPKLTIEYTSTNFTESIGIGDGLAKGSAKSFSESIVVDDILAASRTFFRLVEETMSVSDFSDVTRTHGRSFEESVEVFGELYGVISELRNKTGVTPLWILKVEFATGTIYLSDQEFYIDSLDITTKSWVKSWNPLDMDIGEGGLSLITTSDMSLDLINDQDDANNLDTLLYHASNLPEATNCELYLWVQELEGSFIPPMHLWSGNFAEYPKTDELTYGVQLVDSSMRFEYSVGELLKTSIYPNADPDDVGKAIPIIYGNVKNVPALAIDAGWVTTVAEDIIASATSFNITDGTGLSEGDTVQIEDEKILVGTISTNVLSGCTRGYDSTTATTHDKGIQLGKIQTEYWYLVADHPVKSIGDVYVDGVRQVGTDFVKYVDDGGKAKIKFTALPVLRKSVDVEVDDNVKVQDYSVSHSDGINHTAVRNEAQNALEIYDYPFDADWIEGQGYARTVARYANPGFAYSELLISMLQSVSIWNGLNGDYVYVRLRQAAILSSWQLLGYRFNDGDGWQWRSNVLLEFETISSGDVYIDVYHQSEGSEKLALWNSLASTVVFTANATVTGTGDSSKLPAVKAKTDSGKSYYVGLVGNSSADTVIGTKITANIEGYKDDGIGTYTGTPDALIERPDHVFKHFLDVYGGVTNFITNAGPSFSSKGYKFAGVINIQKSFKGWLASFAWQCRSYFRFSMDYAELVFRPDSLSSTVTITDNQIKAEGEYSSLTGPAPSPLDEVLNVIDLRYDRDWAEDGEIAYKGLEPVSDQTSITRYGKKEQPEQFYFDFVNDGAMASSIAAYYLSRYKDRKKDFELDVMLDLISVTFGVGITLESVGLLCEVKKVNIYPGSGQEERNDQIHLIVREW